MAGSSKRDFPDFRTLMNEWHAGEADFLLDKVMAGCAIIAFSDGIVSKVERERMLKLIRRFEPLRTYSTEDFEHAFELHCANYAEDHKFGEDEAMANLIQLRGKPKEARLLVQICQDIASADGDFSAAEWRATIRMCAAVGVDPWALDNSASAV